MNSLPEILDIGCGRKKFPGSLGIDMSAAGQADVLCDWEKTLPFRDSSFAQVRLVHIIEEVDNIFRCWRKFTASLSRARESPSSPRTTRITRPIAVPRTVGIFPVSRCGFSVISPAEYDYYAPANFRERRVRVEMLRLWRALGLEFMVNHFRWFRKFWEYYLSFVFRGKRVQWDLEVIK